MSSESIGFLQEITTAHCDKASHAFGTSPFRRWVVERTLSWLNRFRTLLVRFEKLRGSPLAVLELACALISFRQVIVFHGYALRTPSYRSPPAPTAPFTEAFSV
jgi:hypothetical protein